MLLEQLKTYQDKEVVLELVNGRRISGKVLGIEQQFVRVGTDEGIITVPVDAVQIILEPLMRSLTQEHMEHIAKKIKDSAGANLICYPSGFDCPGIYSCLPPHFCYPGFSCGPAGFSQGGGPPGCTTGYQCTGAFFGEKCFPPGFRPASAGYGGYGDPMYGQGFCGPYQFNPYCGPYQFNPYCGPYQYYHPCVQYPYSGAQCFPPSFACPGIQFSGAPKKPPGMSSVESTVKEDKGKEGE